MCYVIYENPFNLFIQYWTNKAKEASIPAESFDDLLEERKRQIQKNLEQDQPVKKNSDQISELGEDCKEATAQLDVKLLQAKRRLKKKALFTVSLQHQVQTDWNRI